VSEARFGVRDAQPLDALMGDARDVLDGLFGKVDNKDLPITARIAQEREDHIRAAAARVAATPDGLVLIEALCDATVRRPVTLGPYGKTIDEVAMYAKQREGQNETTFLLLAWIAAGRSEQPPQREGLTHAPQKQATRNNRTVRTGDRRRDGRQQSRRRPGRGGGPTGPE
jgi:hypothetical protein